MVQLATELDPSRGLPGATPRQRVHLGRALTQLCDTESPGHIEEIGTLLAAPEARAALVQLFSSALRIVTSRGAGNEEPASPSSSELSGSGFSADGSTGHNSRPAGSSRLDKAAAASSRPTDRSSSSYMAIIAACAHLIHAHFAYELKFKDITGAEDVSPACVQTAKALLQADALAALGRLFAADNRRPAAAKLFPTEAFHELQNLATLLLTISFTDQRVPDQQLVQQLAGSYLLEHWAKELVERAESESADTGISGRSSRRHGSSSACKSADAYTSTSLWCFHFVTHRLSVDILRPGGTPPSACTDAARQQVLSGRCLQYFAAVRAVSDLYAAAGGRLYGLPYGDLLPYLTEDRQPGQRKGQEALSCSGLRSSIALWDTCLDVCPPKALRPLRPRHLLALCLRTARVALASVVEGTTQQQQELQQQQQQEQVGQEINVAVGHSLGGASSAGRLGGVVEALLGQVELRRRLEAKECPDLGVAAMELARSLVLARVSRAGGVAGGEQITEGGNGSGCEGGEAASVGCSGSSSGGDGGSEGEGVDGGGGGGIAGSGQPSQEQPRAWARPLLRDPSFADGWWRLALGIVRAALQQDTDREQGQEEKDLIDSTVVRCTRLLLPLHLGALERCGGCKHWV